MNIGICSAKPVIKHGCEMHSNIKSKRKKSSWSVSSPSYSNMRTGPAYTFIYDRQKSTCNTFSTPLSCGKEVCAEQVLLHVKSTNEEEETLTSLWSAFIRSSTKEVHIKQFFRKVSSKPTLEMLKISWIYIWRLAKEDAGLLQLRKVFTFTLQRSWLKATYLWLKHDVLNSTWTS